MGEGDAGIFPVVRAYELALCSPEQEWLIRDLWAAGGVGVIGGSPKTFKSWMALEMAVSLASGTPCLGAFAPARPSRVLLYMAEDAQTVVRKRLDSLCSFRNIELSSLEIFVITADTLRLDLPSDQRRLRETVDQYRPDMLLLDPLVRLHRIDENSCGEISALLAVLRALQRRYDMAVVLVHHTRKNGSASRPGLALRGSSDIHAFGDTNLYLRRTHDKITLTIEHRAAPSPEPLELKLEGGGAAHLKIVGSCERPSQELGDRVVDLLHKARGAMTRTAIRRSLRARNERLGRALESLEHQDLIARTQGGWQAVTDDDIEECSRSPYRVETERNDS